MTPCAAPRRVRWRCRDFRHAAGWRSEPQRSPWARAAGQGTPWGEELILGSPVRRRLTGTNGSRNGARGANGRSASGNELPGNVAIRCSGAGELPPLRACAALTAIRRQDGGMQGGSGITASHGSFIQRSAGGAERRRRLPRQGAMFARPATRTEVSKRREAAAVSQRTAQGLSEESPRPRALR
jgi:hypothetical protein